VVAAVDSIGTSARTANIRTMAADSTARNVAQRVDALAAALRAAGVPPERSAVLLASAARAAMSAVMLDAVLEEKLSPR
jgi:truncated hemoglobin YjbI